MDSTPQLGNTTTHGMELRHVVLDFKVKRPERKSSASYQAEHRERLKSDSQQWDLYKQRQKQYMKTYLNNLTEEEIKARREKKTLRQKELRREKKQAKERESCPPPSGEQHTKKKTRKVVQESRAYWRERKRIQRANMTQVEKEAVNKRENERRKFKKSSSLSLPSIPAPVITSTHVHDSSPTCTQPIASSTPIEVELIPSISLNLSPPQSAASSSAQPGTSVPFSPSPTKCAKYSALCRVKKILPKSKKSKLYIMKQLLNLCSPLTRKRIFDLSKASQEGSISMPTLSKEKKRRQRKDSDIKKQIVTFYDTVALSVPDKKFYSKRLKVQRKVLDRPISQIYSDFMSKFPCMKVSKRNFFNCRPKNILKMKSMKLKQCLCETCENMQLMYEPLRAAGSPYIYVADALKSTLCPYDGEWASLDCIERKCEKCGTQSLCEELSAKCNVNSLVTYKYWDHIADERYKAKKTKLVRKDCLLSELISTFLFHMQPFSLHRFVDKWQRHQFNSLKQCLPSDCSLIVLDFAENYTCHFQNQAQSAYYALDQVTIHPVVVYTHCTQCMNKHTKYRIYISDDLKHDAHFANHVLTDTLQSLDSRSRFFIFSDNCTSQYKSRLSVYQFRKLAEKFFIERCFFGERHGKSECDSSGGVVKSFLSQSVASGRATLTNASDVFHYLSSKFQLNNNNCSHCSRTFHLVNSGSIDRSVTTAEIPLVKGIKKVHSFKFLSNGILATRQLSCFCHQCLSGSNEECTSKIIPNFEKKSWFMKCNNAGKGRKRTINHELIEGLSVIRHDIVCENNVVADCDVCVKGDLACKVVENINTAETNIFAEEELACDIVHTGTVFDIPVEEDPVGKVGEDGDNFSNPEFDVPAEEDLVYKNKVDADAVIADDNDSNSQKNVFKTKSVRRQLFSGSLLRSGKNLFRDLYNALERCTSFQEMQVVCLGWIFEPLSINPQPQKLNVDFGALKLAPPNTPQGYLPNVTIGDGNCVPRSLSILIFGTENRHMEIRCRIIHELVMNKNLYLDKDFLSAGSEIDNAAIIPKLVSLSDSLQGIHLGDVERVFEAEVFNARLLGTYLGPWQLHAASQILKCGIISLYPQMGPPQNRELLARAFVPLSFRYEEPLYILWSSSRNDMRKEHWVANHVVPLVKMFK